MNTVVSPLRMTSFSCSSTPELLLIVLDVPDESELLPDMSGMPDIDESGICVPAAPISVLMSHV